MDTKIITYVCSTVPASKEFEICSRLLFDFDVHINSAKNIQELFPLLSNSNFHTDYIVFDVDDVQGLDLYDLVKTLYTIINCTVYRDADNIKPLKRPTKIIAMVSESTNQTLFNDLTFIPEIFNFTLKYGPKVNYEMIKECVDNYLNDRKEVPKVIRNLIKSKKVNVKVNSELNLTGRQQQIFDIVVTRGSSNKHIAKMLSISESTVKLHVGAILKKYGVKNRTQLAVFSKRSKANTEVHM
jgi:DNA-binding NarL/FixJ family response regulator